jgi:hypothetical protein
MCRDDFTMGHANRRQFAIILNTSKPEGIHRLARLKETSVRRERSQRLT